MSLLFSAQLIFGFEADTPVTPGASREAQALLTFFADTYGRRIISGQEDGWRRTNGLSEELNYITNTTGKLPALLALDVAGYTDKSPRRDTNHLLAKRAADAHGGSLPPSCCAACSNDASGMGGATWSSLVS